jgi:hypothetical protein
MTPDQVALSLAARGVVDARWRPGMLARAVDPIHKDRVDSPGWRIPSGRPQLPHSPYTWVYDLTDDATGGCLLVMLGPGVEVDHGCDDSGDPGLDWTITVRDLDGRGVVMVSGATLGEACARAAVVLDCWPGGAL